MVTPTPHPTNRFSVLETSTVGSMRDMLTPQSIPTEPRTEQPMPQESSHQPSYLTPLLIHLTTLWRGNGIPLQIHAIGSKSLLLIVALINLGATGKFINIDYIQSKTYLPSTSPEPFPAITLTEPLMKLVT